MSDINMDDLRQLEERDLLDRLKQLENEFLDLRIEMHHGRMTTPSKIEKARKDIARIKTLLREKELGINRGA
ncbi:50S ribosomal protein L29 [Candidatus Aerophobetes bacterium]|nr:50S ribosomal protein L29 [Candidatus Aerophobetes bacterium]